MCKKNSTKQPIEAKERNYHAHYYNDYINISIEDEIIYLKNSSTELLLSDNSVDAYENYYDNIHNWTKYLMNGEYDRISYRKLSNNVLLKSCKYCGNIFEINDEEVSYWYWLEKVYSRYMERYWKFSPLRGHYTIGDVSWDNFLNETTKDFRLNMINNLCNGRKS